MAIIEPRGEGLEDGEYEKKNLVDPARSGRSGGGSFLIYQSVQQGQAAATQYETITLSRGNLTSIVGATGTVRANQTAMIAWSTSGQIDNILVGVGEKVTAGQELATLAETSLPQNVILASADLVTAQRNLENLMNSNTAFAQAQLNLNNAQKAYNSAVGNQLYSDTVRYSNQDQVDAARAAVILAQDKVNKAEGLLQPLL